MDEIVESENIDVVTVVTPSNVKKVESNHETIDVKNNGDAVEPKIIRKNNFRPPVIEDWNFDNDSEVEFIPNVKDKTIRPSTEKIKFVKSTRETVKKVETPKQNKHYVCDKKVIRPVWNNSNRVNHKNFVNKMSHLHPNRKFVPQAVLTRSSKINTVGASVNTIVRPVNTAGSKTTMSHPRPISNAYKKGYSQVTRPFNKYSANKNSIFNKKVNTVRVKDTTARDRAVVSENKGKGVNAVKASACWGNPQQKEYKEKGVIDSGCSRHMTGNKCYLTEYEDYDGGFVSFGDGKGLTCLFAKATIDESNLWHRRLGHINFKNMNKLVRGNLVRGLPSKIFENDHSCVACQKGKQHKASFVAKNQTKDIAGTRDNIVVGPKDSEEDVSMKPTKVNESGASDKGEEDEQDTRSEFERLLQQEKQTNSTNSFNTVGTPVSAAGPSFTNDDPSSPLNVVAASNAFEDHLFECFSPFKNAFAPPHVLNMFSIDDTGIFSNAYDDEDVVRRTKLTFNNLETIDMDVKSAFLYGTIEEEVYVCQPPGFEDPHFPNKVYKVEKALYGLHQAPKAWYETLSTYLIENGFRRGTIDKTLFIKKDKGDILLVQVYVDDIIFGSIKKSLCDEFEGLMHKRFQMSSIGELTFFLGLQVQQKEDTNKAMVKDEEAKAVDVHLYRSMIGSLMYLTTSRPNIMFAVCACACARDSPFDLEAFSDSDYTGASLDRKSTTRGCQFLGKRLISWQCKKQTIIANSTTKAEYVADANCCGQVLWIQNQMLDYGFNFMNTKIYIDNESTICIVKNLVFHSKTKHIEIRHHFIRDSYEKKLIQVIKIHTDHNVADLLTKAFDSSRPINLVTNETVYKEWEDIMERAATITSSLDAECHVTILGGADAQTRIEASSKQSNNLPLLRGYTLGSGEDSMKLLELMELCIKLSDLKKQSRRKQKKNTEVPHPSNSTADVPNKEHVPTHSNDPLLSGEDRMKLTELMDMYTKLSERVLDLEHTKTAQAQEITNLKLRVKKLEKKAGLRTHKFKRLYKVGVTRRVESSDDESLGAQEDASKQGRSRIEAIDRDAEVTLVETQRRNDENDDNLMFDTGVFDGDEIVVETEEPVINAATTTKSIPVSTDEIDLAQEITLAQALAAMKSAKPKEKDVVQESSENVSTATTMVSTATTTVVATPAITTPPQQRAKGIAFREPVESTRVKPTTSASGYTKNNRITRPLRSNQKNKVEDHPRKIKSSLNKMNSVSEPISNALVKHYVKNSKFESICTICNKCLFDANHDTCLVDFVNDVNVRSKSKSKRNKKRKAWKPMRKVFTDVGIKWKPTGRFFTIVGSRDTNLYTISLDDMLKTSPICLLSKASKTKSWLWHRHLSHLNFGTLNKLAKDGLARGIPKLKFQKDHLCSACALGKSKKSSHQPKAEDTNQEKLYLLHMDLCGPMRVESINGKKYILVIVDDYSRFTWVKFLRSKDEAPDAIIKCIKNIQVRLNATVRNVRTDNGTEFVNQTLRDFYENVGISHQTSVARTPQQNGIVERQN
ncbi:putative ribonuclease H-like domain-containing protein [Tanacetum coccineum]|uniref:Ribonuclease H-like domain-containing protein n=1 Tax=Tanacetum coccineum TaxID=301880 RepID=A0ABQ5F843_9ASTR